MINRAAILLRYKDPFVKWINESDPYVTSPNVTIEEVNEDRTVYLISDTDGEAYMKWIGLNYKELFENELESWYTDSSLWPRTITKKLFLEWCEVECHSVLIDTFGGPLVDDDL